MGVISDEFWAAVESVMPSDEGKRGNRFGDHRLILEGIAWRFRTGSLLRHHFTAGRIVTRRSAWAVTARSRTAWASSRCAICLAAALIR